MDKYLQPNSSYNRLLEEYKKYNSITVAVDFDDTLFDFHKNGGSYEDVKQLVRDLHRNNCYIIIWTGNEDIDFVSTYLKDNNVPYHSINEDNPVTEKLMGKKRKLYSNVLLDDRAGLYQVYNELKQLLHEIS